MNGYLLDTNTVSEPMRPRPDPAVLQWLGDAIESNLYLSVLTLGEIRKGIARLSLGRERIRLEGWLDVDLHQRFDGRILPITSAVADRWGCLEAEARRRGRPIQAIDGLLAATALEHNLMLVTRNTRDFAHTHVSIFNPWTR